MFFSDTETLRWFRLWWTLGWIGVALVWYLSLIPSPPQLFAFHYADKLEHTLAYACLMGWFGNIYHQLGARLGHAVLLVLMGIAIEFIQGLGAYRQFEIADMLANTCGVTAGYVATLGRLRLILQGIESRLCHESTP